MSMSPGIPSTLRHPNAARFWAAIALTGVATGIGAILLTKLLEWVQRLVWGGTGTDLLDSVQRAPAWHHIAALAAAGVVTGAGQILLRRLSSANGIDTTAAIWFQAGRLPAIRTLGSAILSVIIVGMGVSLGREGAPKQAGSVFANFFADKFGLTDEQRQLIVACAAGAGMSAAYGVPVGGALFSLEVMRGILALRYVLPALVTSVIATAVSWIALPDAPTYHIPAYANSSTVLLAAVVIGLAAGPLSVLYVRMIAWADRNKPANWQRIVAPVIVLTALGVLSIVFPQVLGNGRDLTQQLFSGAPLSLGSIGALLLLRPLATVGCVRAGAPGGLFTPSLTIGALLGAILGVVSSIIQPGIPVGLFALLGAGAVLAATTQGPISTVVLLMELTGRDRSFVLPVLAAVCTATLLSRTIELRSIYDARLTDEQLDQRQRLRAAA